MPRFPHWIRALAVLTALALPALAEPTPDEKFAAEVLRLTNAARAANKLPPLRREPRLDRSASLFSRYMGEAGFFDHVGPDGVGLRERFAAQGYPAAFWGENIAWGVNLEPKRLVDDWLSSATHRKNILNGDYQEIGIGLAWVRGRLFVTQDLGMLRPDPVPRR